MPDAADPATTTAMATAADAVTATPVRVAGPAGPAAVSGAAAGVAGRAALAVAVVLLALNLRPLFPSASVVLPEILASTGLSTLAGGALTTLPVLCLGLFAPLAAALAARWTFERALLGVVAAIAVGSALRGAGTATLFAGTLLAGAAIAVGNVLVPALIKRDFPDRVRSMTGLYTMALCTGASLAAGLTVPLARALGGRWDLALAAWALPAAVAALVWLPRCRAHRRTPGTTAPALPSAGLSRDRLAWSVTLFMGLQSLLAYAVMGWLAPILRWRGVDAPLAGAMVSASLLTQAAAALLTPLAIARRCTQSAANAAAGVVTLTALAAVLFGPTALLWPVAVLLGAGQGAQFTLGLTMILLRSPDARVAASLSGMAQTVGYVLAAAGPLAVGAIRDASGGFGATLWLYAAVGLGAVWFGWHAGAPRLVLAPAPAPPPARAAAGGNPFSG